MTMNNKTLTGSSPKPQNTPLDDPLALDLTLRPKTWDDYVGQDKVKQNVRIIIKAASQRKDPSVEHILFYGGRAWAKQPYRI